MDEFAQLAMYPFPALVTAWEGVWSQVCDQVPWVPRALTWPADIHATWRDPNLVVGMTCGWPLYSQLVDAVTVIGAFRPLTSPDVADGAHYRTRLVSKDPACDVRSAPSAAVNSVDSLSGWVSLRAAGWSGSPESVVWTGAHAASLAALQRDEAVVASIDSVSFHLLDRLEPSLTRGLHTVGYGPWVYALPIITRPTTTSEQLAELRRAFAGIGRVEELAIGGFEPLAFEQYASILETFVQLMNAQ